MTGYTVHTGSTVKFTEGWDRVFTGSRRAAAASSKKTKAAGKAANSKSATAKPSKAKKRK